MDVLSLQAEEGVAEAKVFSEERFPYHLSWHGEKTYYWSHPMTSPIPLLLLACSIRRLLNVFSTKSKGQHDHIVLMVPFLLFPPFISKFLQDESDGQSGESVQQQRRQTRRRRRKRRRRSLRRRMSERWVLVGGRGQCSTDSLARTTTSCLLLSVSWH